MRADIGSKTEAVWKQLLDASSSRNERRNAWWETLGMIAPHCGRHRLNDQSQLKSAARLSRKK
ncbi:hypothetical protein D3C73_833830 [compost metagenome]